MHDKQRKIKILGLVGVGAIWFVLLIGLWLFLPGYVLGAEGNAIPLPQGAVARLGLGWIGQGDRAVAFSPDGRYLAVATSIGIELRDAHTLKLIRFFPGHTSWARSVAFSPDGGTLASDSWDETIKFRREG